MAATAPNNFKPVIGNNGQAIGYSANGKSEGMVQASTSTGTPGAAPGSANSNYTSYNADGSTTTYANGVPTVTPAPAGRLNAVLADTTNKKADAPTVITSDTASKDLANKQNQINQLNQDTEQHKLAMQQVQPQSAPDNQGSSDKQNTQQTSKQSAGALDDQIQSIISGLGVKNVGAQQNAINSNAQKQTSAITDAQSDLDDQFYEMSNNVQRQLSAIRSGTYPLSPAEQTILTATQSSYQAMIEAAQQSSKSIAASIAGRLMSEGASFSSPTSAAWQIQATIDSGTKNVAYLNSQAALALAQVEQGFNKQNYDQVQTAWEDASAVFKQRGDKLTAMLASVNSAAKDQIAQLKDNTTLALTGLMDSHQITYQEKQLAQQDRSLTEQQRHNLITEARSRYEFSNGQVFDKATGQVVSSPDGSQTSDAFASTIKLAASTGGTNAQRASIANNLSEFIANGDYKSAFAGLANATADGLKGAASTNFRQAVTEKGTLSDLADSIKAYADAGGNTNILKGTEDEIQKKLGVLATDPKYAALANEMDMNFQAYRQNMTGAAFGAKESAEYAKVLPGKDKTLDLNLATIEGANNYYNSYIDNTMGQVVGQGGKYIREYAEGATQTPQQTSEASAVDSITSFASQSPTNEKVINDLKSQFPSYTPLQIWQIANPQ